MRGNRAAVAMQGPVNVITKAPALRKFVRFPEAITAQGLGWSTMGVNREASSMCLRSTARNCIFLAGAGPSSPEAVINPNISYMCCDSEQCFVTVKILGS